ncbi:15559_t:CDS:2, partial [Dentiscutata erythropus]
KISHDLNSAIQPCNRSHKKKGMNELKHELFNLSSESDTSSSINHNNVIEVFTCKKVTHDGIDVASQHLAQLCDKAIDAEDRANRANQEEILCWCLYWKNFRDQLDEVIRSNSGKFGEKKVRGILYDSITEQLSLLQADHVTKISETTRPGKTLPIPEEDSSFTPADAEINVTYDDVYFDDSDESIDSNYPIHNILLREEIARLE